MSRKPKDPCKKNACKIQACLNENNFQEDKCLDILEQMRLCCVKWHSESTSCSGIDIERNFLAGAVTNVQAEKRDPATK